MKSIRDTVVCYVLAKDLLSNPVKLFHIISLVITRQEINFLPIPICLSFDTTKWSLGKVIIIGTVLIITLMESRQ